jgi:hypothetical protein
MDNELKGNLSPNPSRAPTPVSDFASVLTSDKEQSGGAHRLDKGILRNSRDSLLDRPAQFSDILSFSPMDTPGPDLPKA